MFFTDFLVKINIISPLFVGKIVFSITFYSYFSIKDPCVYPLNQSQISRFTELLLINYERWGRTTVWDVYNAATELYKANSMDIPSLLPQNRAMVNFLAEQYAI